MVVVYQFVLLLSVEAVDSARSHPLPVTGVSDNKKTFKAPQEREEIG
jgi:hypothetical protein